jgi:hypothetical protein
MLSGVSEDSLPYRLSTVRARQIIKRALIRALVALIATEAFDTSSRANRARY